MVVALLTPVVLATAPMMISAPTNIYSHQAQTTEGACLSDQSTTTATGTQHNTTMPTVGTNTGNQVDNGSSDSDLGGGDSTVTDYDAD